MDADADLLLRRLVAESEIRRVLAAYSQGVDRQDWARLRSVYHDDALDRHGPYNGSPDGLVEWVKQRHENVISSMHVLCNIAIDLDDSLRRARVETYCITHQLSDAAAAKEFAADAGGRSRMTIACRYVDDFEHRDGPGWRIRERNVVYEWIKVQPDDESYVEIDPAWQSFRRDREDRLFAPLLP